MLSDNETNTTNSTPGSQEQQQQPQPPNTGPNYRFNALKHGLTAKTLIFHIDEIPFYDACVATIAGHYVAGSAMETVVVQEIADTTWKLQRAAVYESALFAKGRAEAAGQYQNTVPEEQRAIICDADTFHLYAKSLNSLSMQQQRAQKYLKEKVQEFEKLRSERELISQIRADIATTTLLEPTVYALSPLVDSVFSRQYLRMRNKFKKEHPGVALRIFDLAWGDPKAKTAA